VDVAGAGPKQVDWAGLTAFAQPGKWLGGRLEFGARLLDALEAGGDAVAQKAVAARICTSPCDDTMPRPGYAAAASSLAADLHESLHVPACFEHPVQLY